MPSIMTHAAAAAAIAACCYRKDVPRSAWAAGIAAAIVPDFDAIGYWMGVPYESMFGHRGFTHSLFFAALGGVAAWAIWKQPRVALFFFLSIASHGILDAFTDGGGGIAFLSPLDTRRFFAPWRPIEVAPMSISGFFTRRGWSVFRSELVWVWIPATIVAVSAVTWRNRATTSVAPTGS